MRGFPPSRLVLIAALIGCQSPSPEPAPPAATATPVAAADAPAPAATPLVISDDDATIVEDGFQFFTNPTDPEEFEIDADGTKFTGYTPMAVDFGAKALNGTPPFTFTWNFGDGSPGATGNRVSHTFDKTGRIDVLVEGEDATGAKATVTLALVLFTREEWAERNGVDLATLPTPAPAAP